MADIEPEMKTINFEELEELIASVNEAIAQASRTSPLDYLSVFDEVKQNALFQAGNISLSSEPVNQHFNKQTNTYRLVLQLKNLTINTAKDEEISAYYNSNTTLNNPKFGHHLVLDNITFRDVSEDEFLFLKATTNRYGAITIVNNCNFEEIKLIVETDSIGYSHIKICDSFFDSIIVNGLLNDNINQIYNLLISGNEIVDISIYNTDAEKGNQESHCQLEFINKNKITSLSIDGKHPKVINWGMHEELDMEEDEKAIGRNRKAFIILRKQAVDEGNRLHELLFQRHIAECDAALISLEKWEDAWQEKIIMRFGRWLSNHGTSWFRPILWMVLANFLATLAICFSIEPTFPKHFLRIFAEISYPLSTFGGIIEKIDPEIPANWTVLASLTAFHKFFYAICAYEFIRAARRFTVR